MSKREISLGRVIQCACMSTLLALAPAQAQPTQRNIEAKAGEGWHHQHTGVTMPVRLGGFDRQYIRDNSENELDVLAQYHGDETRTRLTLFLYRAAINNVPLWFDVANHSLRDNVDFVPGTSEYLSSTFTPPGQSSASGMMTVYSTEGSDFKSTGVAMLPLNGWLVKVRFTSTELSVEAMEAALEPILNDIIWPEKIGPAPTAVAISSCEDSLTLTDKVRRINPTLADALIGGLTGIPGDEDAAKSEEEAAIYCRDPQDFDQFPIYRKDGTKDGYLLPLGDAGRAAVVFRNELGGLVDGSRGTRYSPILMHLDRNVIYPDLNILPTPQTLLSATGDDAAISTVTTWPASGGSTVTISVSPDEEQ